VRGVHFRKPISLFADELEESPTEQRKLVHVGMYFISPILLLLFLMLCRSRRRREKTFSHRSWPIEVRCDALNDFLVEQFSFTIAYVDPDIAGKKVGETNTQLSSWHWTADDESILLIVTSIVDTTILSIVNAVIAGLPEPSKKSASFGAAGRSLMEMVVRTPGMIPQSSIAILLLDEYRQ
jgi:hypothetical protein